MELIGGGVRVPKIQQILSDKVGKKLGLHMNGDDSMAFGAAFIAANFSAAFRSKQKLFLTHGTNYDLLIKISNIHLNSINSNNYSNSSNNSTDYTTNYSNNNNTTTTMTTTMNLCEEEIQNNTNITNFALECIRPLSKNSKIFFMQSEFGKKKKVNFKYDDDFIVEVYEQFSNQEPSLLMTYQSKGIREIVSKINNSTEIPRIMLNFNLDNKGLIDLKVSI